MLGVMARSGSMRQALYAEVECASVDSFQVCRWGWGGVGGVGELGDVRLGTGGGGG